MKRFITGILAALLVFTGNAYAFDSNYVGLGAALHRPKYADPFNWEDQVNALVAAGVKWVRIGADWRSYFPNDPADYGNDLSQCPNMDVLGKIDKIVDKLHANGIQMLMGLSYSPKWASSNPDDEKYYFYPPEDLADWEAFVAFMTERYKGKVTAWEVWNEPDYDSFWKGTVEEYYELIRSAYGIIKETDPNNQVVLGGLTVSERDEKNQLVISGKWFDNLVALGGGNYFDIINYHAYVDSWRMDEKYNCLMEVVNKYPVLQDKKIWLTETGASSYVSGSSGDEDIVTDESIKTEFIEQTYAQHKRYDNIERIFIYTFTNPTNNTDKENNFGLATYDGQPFDAYYHFQALGGAQLDFSAEQNETWQTLTYDAADVDGDTVRITDGQLQLGDGASLGLRLNDQWVYDADGVLEAQQAYVDVDYPAGQKGAKWQIVYDGQAGAGMESAVFTIPDDKAGTGTVLLEDIKFANGLDGDDLRLRAVDGPLTASGVTVRKMAGRAVCILGETNQNISMKLVSESNESGNGYTMPATIGGKECRKIGGDKKWFYFIVAHGVARAGDTHVTVEIEYYDQGTDALVLAYNNPNKKVTIQKTGTNTWKTARIELTDADFAKNQSYGGDFHIENGGDGSAEYVHSVIVTCHPDYAVLSGFEQVGGSEVGVVTFQNQYDDQPKRAAAAMGLFEDGRLVDIQYQDITVPPGKQSHTVLLQPETERQEGQQWKLFVWDDKMQPLTEPAVSG